MARPNPAFAQVHDHRHPTRDNVKSAVVAGAHAGQAMAVGKAPGLDDDAETQITENNEAVLRGEETPQQQPEIEAPAQTTDARLRSSTSRQNPYSTDAGLSWGRSGAVEMNPERGAVSIPSGAGEASGFGSPMSSATTTTMPTTLGAELRPVSSHGADGNWNMEAIIRGHK